MDTTTKLVTPRRMTTLFEEYRIFSIKLVDLCLFEFAVYLGLLLLKKSFFFMHFSWQPWLPFRGRNLELPHFTVVASMQRALVFNAWEPFNGPISRVNLPLFTLIVRKGKISETYVMRSWTWVWKKTSPERNGNKKERKCDNRNVAETGSFVSDSETQRKRVPSMEN